MKEYRGYNRERRIPVPELTAEVSAREATAFLTTTELEDIRRTHELARFFGQTYRGQRFTREAAAAAFAQLSWEEQEAWRLRPTKAMLAEAKSRIIEHTTADDVEFATERLQSVRSDLLDSWEVEEGLEEEITEELNFNE